MKKPIILIIAGFFTFLFAFIVAVTFFYRVNLGAVKPNSNEEVEFIIENGTPTSTIIKNLASAGLVKNELVLKIYAKLNPGNAQAGRYVFTKSMAATDIYSAIINGKVKYDTIKVTFVEGKRLSYIEKQIADNFDFTIDEIHTILEDKEYIKELINKYDVLTEDILNDKIYHPLEGYLFADTYEFLKDSTIKDIIEKMIGTLDSKISKYKNEINDSKLSIHELMTLASIIELEGARSDDRKGVSGVFYNRLNAGWTLGSDVTTYYAVNKDFSRDLTWSDLKSCNGYNTRGACVKGLPVGPIASPSIASIEAAIEPTSHNYYYFVADKNGKTYFSKTEGEHQSTIRDLQAKNLWYTYN